MKVIRSTMRQAEVLIGETVIEATAPATESGFSDLVLAVARGLEAWRTGMRVDPSEATQ